MRRLMVVALALASSAVCAANPAPRAEPMLDTGSLHAIASWLRVHGRDGYIGADVADTVGIPREASEALVAARQRGFRSDEVLRIAQVAADGAADFILFMEQRPDDRVYFYLSTPLGGLQKAFVSIPSRSEVLPLGRGEAELRFRHEVLYWKDRSESR